MAADLVLAILHHLLAFMLFAVLAAELVLVRPGMTATVLSRLGGLDRAYGGTAMVLIIVGVARVIWGAKGWEYYVGNPYFWAKIAAFAAVGLLSIKPTMTIIAWRKAAATDRAYAVPDAEIAAVKSAIHLQAGIFLLIPTFAAVMARGMGY